MKDKGTTDNAPSITIEIERLVLHGFAPAQREAIGEAVEHELARLVGESGWSNHAGGMRLDAGQIEVSAGAAAERIGEQIACAIYATCGAAQ